MAEFTDVNNVVTIRDKNGKPRLIVAADGSLRTRDFENEQDGVVGGGTGGGDAVFFHSGVAIVGAGVSPFPITAASTVTGVYAACNTAPTGADLVFDVNKNGTTIFTTQANRPTIPAVSKTSSGTATPDVTSFSIGDVFTVDIDQIGSSVPGSDITVIILIDSA